MTFQFENPSRTHDRFGHGVFDRLLDLGLGTWDSSFGKAV